MTTSTTPAPKDVLAALWATAGGDPAALGAVTMTGADPVLPSVFRVGTAAAASVAASALAAAELWHLRRGGRQSVSVDMRRAAIAFRSERYLSVDGAPPPEIWSPVSGHFQAGDGRWVQLHCNFPHHRDGVLEVLGVGEDRAAVAAAIARRGAEELERESRARGLCVAFVRTPEEWRAHPHALQLATLPLLEIIRIGDAPPEPLPAAGDRPLSGVRVLDLTRVVAGPVAGRTFASHGAQVMRIAGPHLPFVAPLVIDTGLGKRSAHVDLRDAAGRESLAALVRGSDVFSQGYRPGAIASHGFSPEDLARLRPGIVAVSLCAYGHVGPWAGWRGFDSLSQSATGIVHEGTVASGAGKPQPLPCQALDHATGYLAAFGAMMALARRATVGGSWLVRVSLAQTGRWIDSLGRVPDGFACPDPSRADVSDLLEDRPSPFGNVSHVTVPAVLDETPARWDSPPVPLGTHPAAW